MRLNKIANKFIAICAVLLLIFSLNVSINVTAGLIILNDDGIAYDMFEDDSSITLENCTYDPVNRSVVLEYAPLSLVYDHKNKPNNIDAYYDDKPSLVPGGDLFTFLSTITNPNFMKAYEFTSLSQIDAQDSQYLETESIPSRQLGYSYPPLHLFEIQIDEDIDHLDTFRVNWWPGPYEEDANLDEITMYMWSYGDFIPRWNKIGKLEYTIDNINNDSIGSIEDADKYISEDDGTLHVLLVGKPTSGAEEPAILSTDYVNVSLSTVEGYNPSGYVISDVIDPATFYGWESVRWESSRPTEDSYVKLQITDASGNPLDDNELDGNSDGFTTSPIDLSSLGSSRSEIRIKALLHSEKYDITPRFYSWIVLWQTTDGFFDRFTYDFRIEKSSGVKIEGGEVTVSEFYSEWPIFGKNPANTRSYVGLDVEYEGNKTYWQSYINKDLAGWFRSPVMYDGKVYIGANDKKIYAFNATYDPTYDDTKYPPSDESPANYDVETAVAVDNGYVVVGTSTLNSKNKIYALNSTNLSRELWEYTISGDNTICYTAAPTISDGTVYITSWSGKFANSPIISNLCSKLNEILGYRLLDNKLIALDITSGNEIWKPIDLPAGSLSTPAVDNGLIFVGCGRIEGSSAFAFDEDTGEEIWNTSIGTVGRAAPVVIDGQDGKIVIFVVREQTLVSFKGTDKVVALNAEDGSMLWNFTIGNQSSLIRGAALLFKNFTNLQATSPPAATPAVFDNTVFVTSANGNLYAIDVNTGEEKWVFTDTASTAYHSASPVVVDDTVYIVSQRADLYALKTSNGEIIEEYPIVYAGYDDFYAFNYGSPIVTDGLVIVSIIDWLLSGDYYGHLMCLGEHTNNSIGTIYSMPIHVQSGNWWDKFNADYTNTTENTITFSILDEEGTVLMTDLNGTHNNISSITQNIIQLCAELNIGNYSDTHPVLNSWGISWTDEKGAPEFIDSTFIPSQEGWINLNLEKCSIEVKDLGTNGIISGIDVDSAEFDLEYKKSSGGTKTDTFDAFCEGESGDEQVKVIANLSDLNIDIEDMVSIEFKIKDLASNQGNSSKITFTIDSEKPSSYINGSESYLTKYNKPVTFEAIGDDDSSGVKSIALYYRPAGSSDWIKYGEEVTPYIWSFESDTSDEYEFCTRATDKASNVENFPGEVSVSFQFDMNDPSKPSFADEYSFNQTPEFTDITFADDYELESIEYRLNTQGTNEWTIIAEDINDDSYTEEWSLSENDWDDLEEDVIYYLYFRVTDICGNEYITPDNDEAPMLTKDVSPPIAENVTFDLSDYDEGGWDDSFTITANIPDDVDFEYVSLLYSYSSDNKEWSGWESYGEKLSDAPFEWDFKAEDGSGYYKFKTLIYDAAGNVVESPEETVSVTLFPTTLVLVLIILIFITLMVSIFVVIKMKKY